MDRLLEDREVGAQLVRIELGAGFHGHPSIVLAKSAQRAPDSIPRLGREDCDRGLRPRRSPTAYAVEGPASTSAAACTTASSTPEAVVRLPLATTNRHGLIAGATGTGKTKTLQLLAEQLSDAGVAVFAADYKGDLSGLAEPAPADGPAAERMAELGLPFEPAGFPVEFLSLGGIGPGVPVRATVTDFGPQLLAKVLGANETQESSLALALPLRGRARPAAGRPRGPARAPHVPRLGRRARPTSRASAASRARRSACCCARSSRSRTAAATSSSASRSSRSPTCCARPRTGAA